MNSLSSKNLFLHVLIAYIIIIAALPFFKTKPEDVYPLEDDDAEFHCEADGSPKPSVKWTINGKPIEGTV
jgi:hypothetical protein